MREKDVEVGSSKITRWEAVFKCVELFLEEQLQGHGSEANDECFVSLLIFNEKSKVILKRERLKGKGTEVRSALKDARRERPHLGTSFSAAFKAAKNLASSVTDDKIMLVFLTDGRPGDLKQHPPRVGQEMPHKVDDHGTMRRSAGYYLSKMQKTHQQFNLQLICLHNGGKKVRSQVNTFSS